MRPRWPGLTQNGPALVTDTTERWLPVPDFEGYYDVSDLGRVRSVRHMTQAGWRGGKVLAQWPDKDGYYRVNLSRQGKITQAAVHVLVLRAFAGEPEPGQQARHGPNGKQDNRATELCWGTGLDQAGDKRRDGTMARGERQGNAKLSEACIIDIRSRAAAGEDLWLLTIEFEISWQHVQRIITRESWAHVP
jgi:NUMOD4 motif